MMKSAIVIDPSLPLGFLANGVACISSGIFLKGDELVGPAVKGEQVDFPPITKIPILILKPGDKSLLELCKKAKTLDLKYIPFTKEAQGTTNYEDYAKSVEGKPLEDLTLLGLGVVGSPKVVNSLVGSLPMLR